MSSGAMVQRRTGAKRSLVSRVGASVFLALLGVPVMAGCEDCGGEPPTTGGEPSIIIQSTSRRLQADGVTFIEVTVRAYDESFAPDNTAITAQVDTGTITSDEHTVTDDGSTVSGTPSNGALTFRYTCARLEAGTVAISATNGKATATSSIQCTEPAGTVTLGVLTDDVYPCTNAIADGESYCVVPLEVMLTSPTLTEPVPQPDVTLTAAVEGARLTDPDDGQDPVVANLALLARDEDNGALPQAQVSLTTDEAGAAAFRVHTRLDEPMAIDIKIAGTAANGQALEQTIQVAIAPFESRATLGLVPEPQAIGSELQTQLVITATDHQANPPGDGARVRVTVPPTSGATLSGPNEGDVFADGVLDASIANTGTLIVTFTAPAVDEITSIPVTVSYQPHPTLPVLSAATEVRVFPDESLLLNVQVAPGFIRSDDNTTATVTATVTEFSQGTESPKAGADVRFRVSSLARDRVGFGTRPNDGLGTSLQQQYTPASGTDSNGVATAIVSSKNERVRGTADIIVDVYDAGVVVGSASVSITLEREPILQSIVFLGAEPTVLGVRGGAYPSTALVTFQVFDDLAQPLANVPMTFDLNATADPGAVVVPHATTNAEGVATTTLSAGTQAGPLSVVATAVFNGDQMTVESLPVAVTAGLPSFANSYLQCNPAQQAQVPPISAECTVVLADRFTNRAPEGLAVQFRAEGGNIEPAVFTGANGAATATYQNGPPGGASTSLLSSSGDSWSYGAVVPLSEADTLEDDGTRWGTAEEAACFDGDSNTLCSVFDLCFEAEHAGTLDDNEVYCPLLVDSNDNVGCWNKLEAAAVTRDAAHLSPGLLAELGLDQAAAQNILDNLMTPQVYYLGNGATPQEVAAVRRIIDAHLDNMFRCGPVTACITGHPEGVPFIEGDECGVAQGCMDFNPLTRCPHDGLRTITAIVRGEESFTDLNGNGILDFEENPATQNGRHDRGEPLRELGPDVDINFHDVVVDLPEPFLDKDDNCFADDYTGSLRLTTYNAIRRNDLYSDEDDSGSYGYVFDDPDNPGTSLPPQLTNGRWDRDKQIFFSDHILVIEGGPRLEVGAPCDGNVGDLLTCPYDNKTYRCEEAGGGTGIHVGCYPRASDPVPVASTAGVTLRYRWVDANGNCYSPGFGYYSHVYDDTDFNGLDDIDLDRDATTVQLTREYCGFGARAIDRREWCDALPGLGRTPHLYYEYTPTCYQWEQSPTPSRTLRFVLTDSATIAIGEDESNIASEITFRIDCP